MIVQQFKKIYIEITNACNLSCDFCPTTCRELGFMSIDLFSKILDQVKGHTGYLYFHVKGEPLLHPEIDKFLDISYEKGFKVNITTNGTLIDEAKDKLLLKPALRQVNFSLHSFDGNEMNQDKAKYINSILTFIKEATSTSDVIISLRLWNLEDGHITHPKIKRNYEILEIIEREFNLPYKIQEEVVPGKGVKLADRVYLNQEYRFQWPDLNNIEENGTGFCYGLRNQVAILVDGTVIPCCLDGEGVLNLGNIKVNHFSEIIKSKRAREITEGFSRRQAVEELCRKCGYRDRFSL